VSRFLAINIEGKIGQLTVRRTSSFIMNQKHFILYYSSDLEKSFKEMDKDGSGSLSKEELEAGLTSQGFEGEQAKCIVEELDYDSDGKYNMKEFLESVSFSEMFCKAYKF
jgi:Ca2+-binding EF-hand superfamily protein